MLTDMFTLQQALLACENTLRIEYTEKDTNRILTASKHALENAYQCKLDEPVYVVQAKNELVSENLNVLIVEIAACVQQLAALNSITAFEKRAPINLSDVNFLGFTRESLSTALKYLQDRILYEKRDQIIPALKAALNNVEMSQIKRLFIIMLALEQLGIPEGVAVCAQLLYFGGKMQ